MKIAMLYRAHSYQPGHVELAPGLFVRTEIIDVPDADDLSAGLDHIHERDGEHFINCVSADSQA